MALAGIRRIDQRIEFGLGLSTDEVKVQGCASRQPLLGRGRPDGGHEKRAARQAAVLPRWCSRIEHAYPTPSVFATCRSFVCGAEGFRTPDLRRAESARYLATNFWGLRNSCKYAYSSHNAFLRLSGRSLGLLHGCCTKRAWSKADTSSLSTVIAAPESAWLEHADLSGFGPDTSCITGCPRDCRPYYGSRCPV
jgi:hypothetical protein